MRRVGLLLLLALMTIVAIPAGALAGDTQVPGHQGSRYDENGNGIPDVGAVVTGKYVESYSDDVESCVGHVQYRGTFDDTPYMDSGWIINNWNCTNADGTTSTYNYLIVHETDPRYTDNPDWAIWGNWEYHVLTESGSGNQVEKIRPENHVGG